MADRTEHIQIRCTLQEFQAIQRESQAAGLTMTSYLLEGKAERGAGSLARHRRGASKAKQLLRRALKALS